MTVDQDGRGKAMGGRGRFALAAVPLLAFAALAVVFSLGLLNEDPSRVPSALIGRPAPEFALEPLEGLRRDGRPVPGFATQDLQRGRVSLVNVWASWCGPCRKEHPLLTELAEGHGVAIYGLNYKDVGENARRFLGLLGNPYAAVGVDRDGREAVDWGVYGVPETFVVDGRGRIRHKHVGPLTPKAVEETILPLITGLGDEKTKTGP